MKRFNRLAWIGLLVIGVSILVVGCNRPSGPQAGKMGAQAWIDAPLDESVIPLASYQIVVHGSHIAGVEKFELALDGKTLAELEAQQVSDTLAKGEQAWMPPGPGEYTLEIRAMNNLGEWGDYDQALVRVLGEDTARSSSDPTPTSPTGTSTPPTGTPTTAAASETPEDVCAQPVMLKAIRNLNCRAGSNPAFLILGSFMEGETAVVQAFNPSQTWAYIENPAYQGEFCWVWMNYTEIYQGDPDCADTRQDPPTPTPTKTKTLTPTPDTPVPPADTQKPSVNVSNSPSSPDEGDQITITGTASDNVGVVKIELYLYKQGQPVGKPIKTCPNTTSCSNNVGYKIAGDYVAGIKAFDGAGNYNTRSTTFTVLVELY